MANQGGPGTTAEQLRDLLRRQVQAASDEAIHSGGQVSADQVEALSRLARLAEIHQAAQPARKRKRWPAALLFGCTLLVVSILLFARVRETEIELDLAVSEVSFVSSGEQTLAETMDLASLGASGLREIQLPEEGEEAPGVNEGDAGLRLSVIPAEAGSINLSTIMLARGDQVWLRRTGPPYQCRLSLKGKPAEHRADVLGAVQVEILGGGIERLDSVAPQTIFLQSGEEDADFDLSFVAPTGSTFVPQLAARDLSLFRVDEFLDPGRTVVRRISTIESGSLYFVSLGDQERKLRPGEMIAFEESQGEIRTIRLQDDHIELKYHGRVRGLSTGVDESRRSLMPTWFEWLSARHSLSLLWGTAIFLYGLATATLRWFGRELI